MKNLYGRITAALLVAFGLLLAPAAVQNTAQLAHVGVGLPRAHATATNALYDKGREAFLLGAINMSSDTIKAALVDEGTYTPNLSTDQYYSSVSSAVVGTPATLASKTTTAGVFNAAGVTYTSVTGSSAEAIVIYKDTGTGSTSPLIALIESATGLPVTPNGGNITITWDTGSNKIFKL